MVVHDFETFQTLLTDGTTLLKDIQVVGNATDVNPHHPVIQAVMERWRRDSKPGKRYPGDTNKIALAIEGGGMRGCVSAGATAALNVLGIHDAVDVVYGSSAGAMVGAYFVARQFAGVQVGGWIVFPGCLLQAHHHHFCYPMCHGVRSPLPCHAPLPCHSHLRCPRFTTTYCPCPAARSSTRPS